MSHSSSLSRRGFLRGFGTLVALPAFESLGTLVQAAPAAGAKAGEFPLRMAFVYTPNGKNMAHWTPQKDGSGYEMTRALKPLTEHKDYFQVISGLAHDKGRAHGDGGGDHARANASFLTGCQPRKTAGADIKVGVSVDQIAAAQMGQGTRLPSLELSCDEFRKAGSCDSGYSCAYQANLSWKTESMPMTPERDPREVFERLFGNQVKGEEDVARAKRDFYNKSILDFVMEDTRGLQKLLGRRDQEKLDEYLTSVRQIEKRISGNGGVKKLPPGLKKPAGIPDDYAEHLRLMYDMMVLGFQTDSTRVATFLTAHDGSNRTFPSIGVREAHHGFSHHQDNPDRLEMLAKVDEFYSEQFAYFLGRLKAVKEGSGTLLDNCMIVYGAGISDPNRHNHDNLPVLLAGRGGGLKGGKHVRLRGETPMTNLYMEMLDRAGVQAEHVGDSTGKLSGV